MTRLTLVLASLLLVAPLAAQRMFTLDSSRAVSLIDLATGTRTPVGSVSSNAGTTGGWTYDQATGTVYLTSSGGDSVYRIDITNWSATLIGNYGLGPVVVMHGIEWDPSTNTLYAMSQHDNGLYTVDTTTGLATLVGLTGLTGFSNLGYDPFLNVMYVVNSGGTDSLYTINRATAVVTLIGPMGSTTTNSNGVAFNTDNLTLYMVDNLSDTLYSIDTTTGAATAIGAVGSSNLLGLLYIPGTGRLTRTVHGCGATTIQTTGHPEIGFTVTTTVGNTNGIPAIGFGLTPIGFAFCGTCTVGHEWTLALPGPTAPLTIPPNPAFIGFDLYIQGADILGTGGCPDPMLTATDTIKVAIG